MIAGRRPPVVGDQGELGDADLVEKRLQLLRDTSLAVVTAALVGLAIALQVDRPRSGSGR
ncbi:hypothetical protein BH09ACT8_BH09ACT8_39660 [soil metagenome]